MRSATTWMVCLLSLLPVCLFGQSGEGRLPIGPEDFLGEVVAFHPIARQARLLDEAAQAGLMKAKGAFDPKLSAGYENKTFNGSEYFDYFNTELKVATLPGVDIIGSYNLNEGIFINPERTVPDEGLIEMGASINLGKGLITDQRRADLRTAELMVTGNALARQAFFNNLCADALKAYWTWAEAAAKFAIYENAVDIAEARAKAVRQSFLNGNVAGIDTLEAFIRMEQRRIDQADSEIKLQKARNMALAFLWDDAGRPVEDMGGRVPIGLNPGALEREITSVEAESLANHPDVQGYQVKLSQAQIDRRWKREQLKPALAVKWLYQSGVPGTDKYAPSIANQKVMVDFSIPLFLRKERASVELADLKIESIGLARDGKQRDLLAKAEALLAELEILERQILAQRQIVADYESLFAAEQTLFRLGSSSLFKLQSRESSLIKAQLKLAGLTAQYPRTEADLLRSLGQAGPEDL